MRSKLDLYSYLMRNANENLTKNIHAFLCVGSHCRKDNISGRVLVEPSEFVLEPEGTKVNTYRYMFWQKSILKFCFRFVRKWQGTFYIIPVIHCTCMYMWDSRHNFDTIWGFFQSVIIVLNPSDRETSLCVNSKQIVSTVVAFYGDEISRQRYRR